MKGFGLRHEMRKRDAKAQGGLEDPACLLQKFRASEAGHQPALFAAGA